MFEYQEIKKVESVYVSIKNMIKEYKIQPGTHLHISELSKKLKVSNTPVREALIRLSTENIIASIPKRGFFTRFIDAKEQYDLYCLQCVIVYTSLYNLNKIKNNVDSTKFIFPNEDIIVNDLLSTFREIVKKSNNNEFINVFENCSDRIYFTLKAEAQLNPDENMSLTREIRDFILSGRYGSALEIFDRNTTRVKESFGTLFSEILVRIQMNQGNLCLDVSDTPDLLQYSTRSTRAEDRIWS